MSRINRPPILDGDEITAAGLNVRFGDFTQTDLNRFNHRDAAYDLPQFEQTFSRGFMAPIARQVQIGKADFYHSAPVTINGQAATPSTPVVVGDGVSDTVLGPLGVGQLAINAGDVLRVYWHLNVRPQFTGQPWTDAAGRDYYEITHSGGSTQKVATGATCWVMYLQWDITSAALTNWTEVPFQGDFATNFTGALYGSPLASTTATTVIPCWVTSHDANGGREMTGSETSEGLGWMGASGCYYYDSTMAGTVASIYGLRLVIKGPMHPFHVTTTNYLAQTPNILNQGGTNVSLQHTVGQLGFIKHRTA